MKKWLTEGHGAGLCLSMAAHMCALFHGMVLLEEAETHTDAVTTTNIDIQTTPASTATTVNVNTQTAANVLLVTLLLSANKKKLQQVWRSWSRCLSFSLQ